MALRPTPLKVGSGGEQDTSADSDQASVREVARPPRRLGVLSVVAVVVIGVDQATKTWAERALHDGRTVDVVGSLRFNLVHNTGAAFSQGSGMGIGPWISVIAIAVVVGVSLGSTSRHRFGAMAAGLVAGGAIGNLVDRAVRGDAGFLHGAVTDFIDLQWWPVFNVADSAVVVGAILLVIVSLRPQSA